MSQTADADWNKLRECLDKVMIDPVTRRIDVIAELTYGYCDVVIYRIKMSGGQVVFRMDFKPHTNNVE